MIFKDRNGIEITETAKGVAYRADAPVRGGGMDLLCEVRFQAGEAGQIGVNGMSTEALLAILVDRENKVGRGVPSIRAVVAMEEALRWLSLR